jgi:hypothetical protein
MLSGGARPSTLDDAVDVEVVYLVPGIGQTARVVHVFDVGLFRAQVVGPHARPESELAGVFAVVEGVSHPVDIARGLHARRIWNL